MFESILTYVVSPILAALLGYIVWLLQQSKKAQTAQEKGIMLLLRRELLLDHKRYCIDNEPMQPLAYDDLCEIHDAYKALGGNGMTDKLFKEITAVHLKRGGLV